MSTDVILGFAVAGTFVLYALFGGADFGGGVWDLLASGPRKAEQRALIARAIGPVWEVNHIWLIVGMVLLFAGFPRAFAVLSVALHVPLTLLLLGIVFRGAAFTFRAYDTRGDAVQRRWGLVFSGASVFAPLLLGMCVGAVVGGTVRVEGRVVTSGFFASWLTPFAWAVGALALCLFAFLAAVYLTHEAPSTALREDFRRRALGSGVAVFLSALAVLLLARDGAPRVWEGLLRSPFALALHVGTAVAAVASFGLLWTRRFRWARVAAALQAGLIVLGWAASQHPYLVVPDVTLQSAAASPGAQRLLLVALGVGTAIVVPSLVLLFRVFRPVLSSSAVGVGSRT
ncbi:cytochrome d ubiquinol oxidase subunit II [Comamonas sp. JC664]|uniref:cytochrome d ubiquinol oxidase subunit II n=1 Tax=Comamonas sp. JC664 TaxID=2801917 RepID=UPI00174E142E|nr:cytochrome d ubiquinol oxidase subunit II [Comamonas sp. JC664]MBL0698998.1 cytochrome d ubiquinol oxidase subunit II [Comamonas sp. JC664]GHG79981.1 cytochrome D ubiquinol oxidase subunit II [Comamonas sp. KCTC 72670]